MMATGGGGAYISYVVYIICSVRITLFMLNISQRSALSHILQLHDSGYFFLSQTEITILPRNKIMCDKILLLQSI